MTHQPRPSTTPGGLAAIIPAATSTRYFFKRQGWHLLSLVVMLAISWAFANPALGDGRWLGAADTSWFWLTIALVVLRSTTIQDKSSSLKN